MRRMIALGTVAASAIALAGVALAQNVPAEFVVSGAAAEKMQDFTTINLNTARRIAEACERMAAERGLSVSVTILDNDGNHVYVDRMDGQSHLAVVTSGMKARTVLRSRVTSKERMNRVIQNPNAEFQAIQLGYFSNAGGLPIVVNKQLIGAIGVGGMAANPPDWSDEICAHRAMVEVIGPSVAPLTEDIPRQPAERKVPVPTFEATMTPRSTLPEDWVVSGEAAARVFDTAQISLTAAKRIATACREWAEERGGGEVTYIVNNFGDIVHMERTDGNTVNSVNSAKQKAATAVRLRQPTEMRQAQLQNNPAGFVRSAINFDIFATQGGIPIVVDGQMIGAIGVGGVGVPGGDALCPAEGLKAVFGDRVALPKVEG